MEVTHDGFEEHRIGSSVQRVNNSITLYWNQRQGYSTVEPNTESTPVGVQERRDDRPVKQYRDSCKEALRANNLQRQTTSRVSDRSERFSL